MYYVDPSGGLWADRVLNYLWRLTSILPGREGKGGTFTNLCLTFMQIGEGQRGFLISALSNLPSAQNNPYTKVGYFLGGTFFYPSSSLSI